jgi:uncharacterized membrane protein
MLRGAASAAAAPTRQAITTVLSSWVSRRFLGGLAVILPIAISAFATIKILNFFDHLFAPLLEALLGFRVVGLGFATSMLFIFATGVVASSYVGGALISLGEWVIRRLPLVKHVFSAAKQISAAISPGGVEGENGVGGSFRECVLVKNPRLGNYMLVRSRKERKKEKKEGRKKEKKDRKERESGFFLKIFGSFMFFLSFLLLFPFLSPFFLSARERERERERERDTQSERQSRKKLIPGILDLRKPFKKKKQAFVTGATRLRGCAPSPLDGSGPSSSKEQRDLDLIAVYAATNHFVFGDVFLVPRSVSFFVRVLLGGECLEREGGRRRRRRKRKSSPLDLQNFPKKKSNNRDRRSSAPTYLSGKGSRSSSRWGWRCRRSWWR